MFPQVGMVVAAAVGVVTGRAVRKAVEAYEYELEPSAADDPLLVMLQRRVGYERLVTGYAVAVKSTAGDGSTHYDYAWLGPHDARCGLVQKLGAQTSRRFGQ